MALTSKKYITLYSMNFLSIFLGNLTLNTYKTYGETVYTDDEFLTTVGTVAAFFSAFRFVWSIVQ